MCTSTCTRVHTHTKKPRYSEVGYTPPLGLAIILSPCPLLCARFTELYNGGRTPEQCTQWPLFRAHPWISDSIHTPVFSSFVLVLLIPLSPLHELMGAREVSSTMTPHFWNPHRQMRRSNTKKWCGARLSNHLVWWEKGHLNTINRCLQTTFFFLTLWSFGGFICHFHFIKFIFTYTDTSLCCVRLTMHYSFICTTF